jgi:hypothetical protein
VDNVSLFLGLRLDASYEKSLAEMDPRLRELYISDQPESYLNQIVLNNISYLGKSLGEIIYISDLELLEKNIYSILHKIIPGHSHENRPLEVLMVPSNARR